MKVKINKPCRVNVLSGDVEVSRQEFDRLSMLGLIEKAEPKAEKKEPKKKAEE